MTSSPDHWDSSFGSTDGGDYTQRGWYQATADPSWQMIGELDPATSAVDIGGGASVWVDEALQRGWTDVTVVDWSIVAMGLAQARLGPLADRVTWVPADLLSWTPPRTYGLWHDRAVLHFLLNDSDRHRYARVLRLATHPGSMVVIGGFSATGPDMCAGLPVRRQTAADFEDLLEPDFTIEQVLEQVHVRPDGDSQDYVWVRAVRA